MYLLFIDESGTPPHESKCVGQYLTIAGLIIPDGVWYGIARELAKIKADFKVEGELKWRQFGMTRNDEKSSIKHLDIDERDRLRNKVFDIVTKRRSVKIIACVTCCEAAYRMDTVRTPDDVYELTYKGVTERFQYFLQDTGKETGTHQFGMIIADHRMHANDERLRAHHHGLLAKDQTLRKRGSTRTSYDNIVETIQFSPSHYSVGLQLVDMVAGAIGRYFQCKDAKFVKLLLPSFRASPKGEIAGYGLVKMPKGDFIEPSSGGEAEASPTR